MGHARLIQSGVRRRAVYLAEVGRLTPIPTSSGSTPQPQSAQQISFGRLSQNTIDPSKAQSSTTERANSVLDEFRTPSSSSTAQQSSQQSRFRPYTVPPPHQMHDRRDPAEGQISSSQNQSPEIRIRRIDGARNPDLTC